METTPKHQVEALLFSSGRAMSEEQVAQLSRLDLADAKRALAELKKDYAAREGALMIYSDEQGWRMSVRDAHLPLVRNIVAQTELSRACMETLAVIAYKHPSALQSEVVDTRGSSAYEHIAELERLGFVRKEASGRSYRLKLTDKFFAYFDVAGKDVRSAFKDVRMPVKEEKKEEAKEAQTKLGQMDVVEVEAPERPRPLDGMDVVDVPAQPEKAEVPVERDAPADEGDGVPEDRAQESGERKKFLDDLDERIAQLSKRNDDRAQEMATMRKESPLAQQEQPAQAPETPAVPSAAIDEAQPAPRQERSKRPSRKKPATIAGSAPAEKGSLSSDKK